MKRPERIVHLGLGAFFKAHQAWYTEHATDAAEWGIVAYTGREPKAALELSSQECRYTLVTRGSASDEFEVINSVVRAMPADAVADLKKTLSSSEIALVTMTLTEAGYLLTNEPLEKTALGRLCLALEERRQVSGAPIALVSCDNMPNNAEVLRVALLRYAARVSSMLIDYIETQVSFVSTSVDRITPKTQLADYDEVAIRTGFQDKAVVVTEPFRDWVLEGDFPLGRPQWETAGAKIVADVSKFESRKLWLLNGAHSLMAYAGLLAGLETVDQAISNEKIRDLVNRFWDEAEVLLDDPEMRISEYRKALIERFENPRIGYLLSQIGQQGLTKISVRVAPVALGLLNKGTVPKASLETIGLWISYVLGGGELVDARKAEISEAITGENAVASLLELISADLASSEEVLDEIEKFLAEVSFL